MRIGIDGRFWNETGVGRYIRNLVFQLQKIDKKNEYVLFVMGKDYESIKYQVANSKHKNGAHWNIVKTDIKWHTVMEQVYFAFEINKQQLDLMHFPYFSVPIIYRKPFVITIHDLILHHFPTGQASMHNPLVYKLKLLGYRHVLQSAAKRAEKIITVSHATKKEIIKHLKVPKSKIVVTYEGAQLQSMQLKVKSLKPHRGNYFLHVGNVYPHKNVDKLLIAFGKMKKDSILPAGRQVASFQNDNRLVFVGRVDYFQKRLVEKVKGLHLDKDVIFLDHVSDEELIWLYRNAIAMVAPSLMEGFGLPALEAMGNGCLVLASNIEALREICAGAALYFDPKNIDSIANVLQFASIHDKKAFEKNIETGKKRAALFSWEKMARETLEVYKSCVGLR